MKVLRLCSSSSSGTTLPPRPPRLQMISLSVLLSTVSTSSLVFPSLPSAPEIEDDCDLYSTSLHRKGLGTFANVLSSSPFPFLPFLLLASNSLPSPLLSPLAALKADGFSAVVVRAAQVGREREREEVQGRGIFGSSSSLFLLLFRAGMKRVL